MKQRNTLCTITERPHSSSLVLLTAIASPSATETRLHPESPSPPIQNPLSRISRRVQLLRWCRSAGRRSSLGVRGGEPPPGCNTPVRGEPAGWLTAERPGWGWSSAMCAWGGTEEGRSIWLQLSVKNYKHGGRHTRHRAGCWCISSETQVSYRDQYRK